FVRSVKTDVAKNDLVWLVKISHGPQTATPFPMPSFGNTKSEAAAHGASLAMAKDNLVKAIESLEQNDSSTDLQDPIELGLNVLTAQNRAASRILVLGSDFVQDTKNNVPSAEPPNSKAPADKIKVILLVAQPKAHYLENLHMSPSV